MYGLSALLVFMRLKHLGTDQYQLAGVLVALTHHALPGNVKDNTKQLWAELKALYKELNIKDCYFQLKPSMFLRKKHGGKMRGKGSSNQGPCQAIDSVV